MEEVVENMSDAGNYSVKRGDFTVPQEPLGQDKVEQGEKVEDADKTIHDIPTMRVNDEVKEKHIKPIPMPDDIDKNLQVKRERWCCWDSYVCPWEKFSRPGVLDLLKWKICEKTHPIPSKEELDRVLPVKSNMDKIKQPPADKIQVTWIGHATMLVQMEDMTILTDPVLDSFCGPIWPFGYKRHRNASCQVKDIEKLDAVIISHNHYDHLEAKAVREINAKFKDVHWFVAGGTKAWFLAMDVEDKNLTELDWWHGVEFNGVKFICTPSQHWCQRCIFDLNTCLWCSWVVKSSKHSFYFAGDTGYYENLFKKIGEKYGPFDLAGIPIGAYTPRYALSYQHVDPAEAVNIHMDVKSLCSIGIHWGTFKTMSCEPFLEPPRLVKEAMERKEMDCSKFISVDIGETWVVGDQREESKFMKCEADKEENACNKSIGSWNGEYQEQLPFAEFTHRLSMYFPY
ncbi:N-acyl-phosphatidylethanolamine-hydrolyzing phospholipase D-like isoform X1 [Dreissena polymorpha]|uniref:N-acyl-phosphatidylethanolamine-hydrolyzing phospholipase D-like isoform X1 n=1 Tax=Dreissena polymorpha TaxID=45954 RepID=UPI002264BFFC|nr:N-acyl-phosphatidylethanolamine-hydrolyzing phospholipase D-like isoform X1 [Dreissena polymorpha]XP_052274635.1 N-acyl-phosphatidylethanolamine-hydrolyzing phospholipase D-like isoform X1 [Dreissena polymorpha]XP_052274636.1 N-acyl-phosphatidylethanolamine-hydrolyzing phospholipase D-like isoform X1 [Dreissena polymorpha]XP_052274637.1 N-acyl-phosphatidylethanolamine-hydrolyzing phospholipase D-like isoform X1 [Dreissena polymorpha]